MYGNPASSFPEAPRPPIVSTENQVQRTLNRLFPLNSDLQQFEESLSTFKGNDLPFPPNSPTPEFAPIPEVTPLLEV